MSEGRNFSKEFPSDTTDAIIVNETLVNKFGYQNPVGTILRYYDEGNENVIVSRTIIGVIKDFHYITARQRSEPMIFLLNPRQSFLLTARIAPGQISETLSRIEEEHKALYPERTFRYFFLEDTFDEQFNKDRDFMRNIGLFAGLAVFIGCLGLIGLVAFTIDKHRRRLLAWRCSATADSYLDRDHGIVGVVGRILVERHDGVARDNSQGRHALVHGRQVNADDRNEVASGNTGLEKIH